MGEKTRPRHRTEPMVPGKVLGTQGPRTQPAPSSPSSTPSLEDMPTSAVSPPRPPRPTREVSAPPDPGFMTPGTMLGRYVLLGPLGSGGLGDVYAAFDPELDRKVAIKLLKPEVFGLFDLGRLRNRLIREAQAMAKLSHPNVVTVHDVGLHDDHLFIAMEHVEGGTFRQWLKQAPRSWKEIRDVLVQAGRGLQAAHDAGLVHRDFKPSNVMVTPEGKVVVLDFGLARRPGRDGQGVSGDDLLRPVPVQRMPSGPHTGLTGVPSLVDESVTQTGVVLGTPGYMAPEQYEEEVVDAAADQFGFCVTAYEAFWGQRPFLGKGEELIDAVMLGKITPVDAEPKIPKWLKRAILRGLRPKPAERHANMEALLHALHRDQRSRRWQIIGISTAVVLSGVGGATAYAMLANPDPPHDRIEELADAAHEAAAKTFYVYPPPEERETPTAYRMVVELESLAGADDDAGDERAAELRKEFAGTLTMLGDRYFAEDGGAPFATDYYAQALIFDPDNEHARERVAMTAGELAAFRQRAESGGFSDAELEAAQLLAIVAIDDEDDRNDKLADAFAKPNRTGLATRQAVAQLVGEREQARVFRGSGASAAKAEPKPEADAQPEPEPSGDDESTGGDEVIVDGDAEAEPETQPATPTPSARKGGKSSGKSPPPAAPAEPAIEDDPLDTPSATKADPEKAAALVDKAASAMRRGDLGEAESLLHQALAANRRSHRALIMLSELYYQRSKYPAAAKFAEKAVAISPNNANYRLQLGDSYFKVLRYTDARKQYEKAKDLGASKAASRLERLDDKLGK